MSDADPFDLQRQADDEEAREARQRLEEATDEGDFKWLMADVRGRRIARRWLEKTGVWRLSYTNDPHATAFNEGQRNVGLWLLDRATRWTPNWLVMLTKTEDEPSGRTDDPEA